jgi:hypothetical protein
MSNLWGDATMVGSRPRTSADGTDLTDYEIGAATTKFGVDMIMADIKHDGTPNTTVGITVDVTCRAGKITGYPRPNQFLYNKVSKGQALQVEGVVRVGGCGGELYRPFMVAPRTPHMQKIWTVNRDCCLSVEPGLFDPEIGIGSNFSDLFVVEPSGPSLGMSRVPYNEEWMWISL